MICGEISELFDSSTVLEEAVNHTQLEYSKGNGKDMNIADLYSILTTRNMDFVHGDEVDIKGIQICQETSEYKFCKTVSDFTPRRSVKLNATKNIAKR